MALNVYLGMFRKFDAIQLRMLEKFYFLGCYSIPFLPALIFVFIKTASKGHMYGDATLWCWVSSDWDYYRIGTFYGPVWYADAFSYHVIFANHIQGCHSCYR